MLNLFTSFFAKCSLIKRNTCLAIIALVVAFNTTNAQVSINETEPNNMIATANYLGQDTTMNGTLCPAGSTADVDYFMIKPNSDGGLKINALVTQNTVTGRIVPLDFGFFDKKGRYIDGYVMASDSPGNYASDSLLFYCISADTFYVRVYNDAFTNDCHTYSFSYSIIPPAFANSTPSNSGINGFYFAPYTKADGHNGYYDSNTFEEYRVLKTDINSMELYVKVSTQSGDSTTQLNVFYADSSGNVVGNAYLNVGLNNQVVFDSVYIPASPIDTAIDTLGSPYDDTLAVRISFTTSVCGSYELYYTGLSAGVNVLYALQCNITLSPNPGSSIVKLTINSPQKGAFACDVFNVMGEDVYKTPLSVSSDNAIISVTNLDLSNLPKGIYFVRISNGQRATTRLLAIQ